MLLVEDVAFWAHNEHVELSGLGFGKVSAVTKLINDPVGKAFDIIRASAAPEGGKLIAAVGLAVGVAVAFCNGLNTELWKTTNS
jgi:hypothetical protein